MRSGLGVSFFGTWTWNRELTWAGYGFYLVAQRLPIPRLPAWSTLLPLGTFVEMVHDLAEGATAVETGSRTRVSGGLW